VQLNEQEKIEKYQELARELKRIQKVKTNRNVTCEGDNSKRIRNTLGQGWCETLCGTSSENSSSRNGKDSLKIS